MNRKELMNFLEKKGLLSPEDSLTMASGKEASSLPLTLSHILIVRDLSEKDEKTLCRRLLAAYDETSPVILLSGEGILRLSLKEMEMRSFGEKETILFDSRKAIRRPAFPWNLEALDSTVHRLLAPGGCPWDRSQTHETLRTYFIQEVYEVIDAIDRGDMDNLKEELGDVLFQILFHAALAEKEGYFTMQDVADGIRDKMVRRHPFVFDKTVPIPPFRRPGSGKKEKN